MPKEIIRNLSNSEQNFSDSDSSQTSESVNELNKPSNDNSQFLYWFITNFFAGLSMAIIFMLILVRNQTKTDLSNPKTPIQNAYSDLLYVHSHFFSSIKEETNWLHQLKFSIDKSVAVNDYLLTENYILQQKKLLASIPLSPLQKMVLANTTIHWVAPSLIDLPNKALSYSFVLEPRKMTIALHKGLCKAELRWTLLKEIHHLMIYEINQFKSKDQAQSNRILEFPFMNDQGEIDHLFRAELSFAIDELNENIKDFIALEANKHRNPKSEKKFSGYLDAVADYQPRVYRVSSHVSDKEIDTIELEAEKGTLYRNNRPIVYETGGDIQLLCSANKDHSRLELARAFIYDYISSFVNLKNSYKSRYKNKEVGEQVVQNKRLVDASSAIDAMLTPAMKQVFAKRFTRYFEQYTDSYLSYRAQENLPHLLNAKLSV